MKKHIKGLTLTIFVFVLTLAFSQAAIGQTLLYESKSERIVSRGVTYEYSQRVTTDGILDVHVMTVDITQSHIEVKPLKSQTEHGLKEQTSSLVKSNGAIAGINGDFFGVTGTYSAPFGLEMIDGYVTSASEGSNSEYFEYATLFMNKFNTMFITYVKTDVTFWNNGTENLNIYAHNRVTDGLLPICIDKNAYDTTAELDARFPNLYKLVVENEKITYISGPGEVVTVPELSDGYVIVMSQHTAEYNLSQFAVGQRGFLETKSTVDLSSMNMAISGGSRILSYGSFADNGFYVTGRHPRTAVGISEDGSKLIMMVVDGRNGSIGATHGEMATLMLQYGAYNAMHLDGGGSSTMVVSDIDGMSVENEPSDGSERKVINGLGVFNNSQPSDIVELEIVTSEDIAFKDASVKIDVYGVDEYYNKVKLDHSLLSFVIDANDGYYSEGYFYPVRTGEIWVTASYNDLYASKMFTALDIAQLNANVSTVRIGVGTSAYLTLTGRSKDGHSVTLSGAKGEIVPGNLAYYDNGQVLGLSTGIGYIKLNVGNVERYIKLVVGVREVVINPFEPAAGSPVSFDAFPESNQGHVVYTYDVVESGTASLELAYKMQVANETQVAYMVFDKPVLLPDNPISLKLSVYGDNSSNWLRARIVDANAKSYAIDFARYVNWEGFKTVEAKIPDGVAYPITLESIYIASLENTHTELRKLYFNNLVATYSFETGNETIPGSTTFVDGKLASLDNAPGEGEFDITIIGQITLPQDLMPENYVSLQNNAMANFNKNSSYGLFAGASDNTNVSMPSYKWTDVYDHYNLSGASVINLVATNGNLYSSRPEQWTKIENDLNNAGNTIILMIDKNPLASLPKKESELLHRLLSEAAAKGKNIFVVSAEGATTALNTKDAVRYVNLGGLWKDEVPTENFFTLRIRVGNDVKFSLQGVKP